MAKIKDITGKKFERLLVIEIAENKKGRIKWLCRCDCGNNIIVPGCQLKNGHTKSCGCYEKEQTKIRMTTHGLSKTKTYGIWLSMRRRCTDPKNKNYHNYGGRGISYDPKWNTFEGFYEDMGESNGLTLDRIDVNGNYEKFNCRWVSYKVQNNNRRNNRLITYQDITLTLFQWAEKYNLNPKLLWERLNDNWSIERALTTPKRIVNK